MNKQLSDQLSSLRLTHVFSALEAQNAQPQHYQDLSFNERLSFLRGQLAVEKRLWAAP